jgi:Ca-activated chloride channel family protein
MRSHTWLSLAVLPISLCALALVGCDAVGPDDPRVDPVPGPAAPPSAPHVVPDTPADATNADPAEIEIDLDDALELVLPEIEKDLTPVAFTTPDGKTGWVVAIPSRLPIATPAYDKGRLFVGGGYGSHEFYAFDAETGAVAWQIKTGDDGPTAAVVEDDLVAFNTESCTVIVCNAGTGDVVWQEWLGDPLMSQPAISKGRLYIAYPGGQRAPAQSTENGAAEPTAAGHRLLCADLRTGKHLWDQPITSDVIAAPVVDDDKLYFTCFDGTAFCMEAGDGKLVWKKENAGTSAPLVAGGRLLLTVRHGAEQAHEALASVDYTGSTAGAAVVRTRSAPAPYLEAARARVTGIDEEDEAELDAGVGFADAPVAAGLDAASKNVGVSSVVGGWAFQGSRAAFANDRLFNAQGSTLNCVIGIGGRAGRFAAAGAGGGAGGGWRATLSGQGVDENAQVFAPPSMGARNMYLAGGLGHVASVRQEDGKVEFLYATGRPMVFQPALANGNVYVGTADGLLICLRTGDDDADDWHMWGGNAQHNKTK